MNKYTFVTFLLICFFTNGFAQKTLSDYSYIVIPEHFDFLSEKDKYQTNSLTKFLFNKYGFNAFFNNEVPNNVVTCDGLKADVIKIKGIIYTKLQIVISDCHGNEVYRSAVGKSKIKAFNKVFNDAVRKSFASIIGLNVKQKDIKYIDIDSSVSSEVVECTNAKNEVEVKEEKFVEGKNTKEVQKKVDKEEKFILPINKYSNYKKGDELFLLKKTNKGYNLYIDKNNEFILLGEVLVSKDKVFYLGINEKLVEANFDEAFNLTIDASSGKITYKFID